MGVGRTGAHEAQRALVDKFGDVDLQSARNLGSKAVLGHFRAGDDTGFTRAQGRVDLGYIVSDGGYDPHSCNHDTTHGCSLIHFD